MEFDKSKVYTALNADELKPGSRVIVANDLQRLKRLVRTDYKSARLSSIRFEGTAYRFSIVSSESYEGFDFALAYLVSEPALLKWTDLKLGDVIFNKVTQARYLITGMCPDTYENQHLFYAGTWQDDRQLQWYSKV